MRKAKVEAEVAVEAGLLEPSLGLLVLSSFAT
jgi:hypothetical protein